MSTAHNFVIVLLRSSLNFLREIENMQQQKIKQESHYTK